MKHVLIILIIQWLSFSLEGREKVVDVHLEGYSYSPNSVIIPFARKSRLILIQANVEGHRGFFILDTGASRLVLNSRYFDAQYSAKRTKAYGVSGFIDQVGKQELSNLELDLLSFEDVKADVINLGHIEKLQKVKILGLVGYELLKDYEILFNYRKQYMIFYSLDKRGNKLNKSRMESPKMDSLNFIMANHLPVIPVSIKGKKKYMGLDTGAEYNLLNIEGNKNILEALKITRRIKLKGASNTDQESLGGRLYWVRIKDKYPCGGMSTILTGFERINQIYSYPLDGILGYEFLAPWTMSINYKKRKLYLHKLNFVRP